MSRTRKALFCSTLVVHTGIVLAVLFTTELVRLDWQVMLLRPYKQWPQPHALLDYFVVMGQRGPTAVLVAAWLGWRSWRQRTLRPLLVLGAALLLLNLTVGAVKIGLGRLGPHYATQIGSAELFAGGDIFPSGHTANAVVTWGVLAYLATTPLARRVLSLIAAGSALGVGATTVYIGTHWLSDVLLGWTSGLLIMLALPWFEPGIARAEQVMLGYWDRLRERHAPPRRFPVTTPVPVPPPVATPRGGTEETAPVEPGVRTTLSGLTGPHSPVAGGPTLSRGPESRSHPPGRTHPMRAERGPATPGGRRPHVDRQFPRTAGTSG